ncbi:MAG TPA: hypothetical protein VH143_32910 [Kofleriaceae bacterium]|nr:hypothetical protein [Kofleriaceae bacterium]
MAAESKKDGANGANGANGKARPKRRSSLEMLAQSQPLPSVERSLEEFIARANETATDPESWKAAEHQAKAEDDARRQADEVRWKAAEHQLREREARETSLRRQLDGLQGKLAEAEARAAIAGTAEHDGVVADLKMQLLAAGDRINAAQVRERELVLEAAKARASSPSISQLVPSAEYNDEEADARVRLAEAKATKAIAAARAAAAGLTVNPADLAAIESGLVVPVMRRRAIPTWLIISAAFVGGLVIMFAIFRMNQPKEAAAPAQPAAPVVTAPVAAAPAPAAPSKPIVTPIEDPTPPPPAAAPVTPAPVAPAATVHHAAQHHAAPAAPKPAKPADKPAQAGIVDPF